MQGQELNDGFVGNRRASDQMLFRILRPHSVWLLLFGLYPIVMSGHLFAAPQKQSVADEEAVDYFDRWLKEDVAYIITDEERHVFEQLTTNEEKEQFIEQFWFRRDPDIKTTENEFKTEHYRRIAYANERFSSGKPGWRTDRGRIYIIHGPPDEITSNPTGGPHDRKLRHGGGSTTTFPFEVWYYRHLEGIGSDIELEFVDASLAGEYRLALNPEEKDALLHMPGVGQTYAEEMGLATKADRPYFSPGNRGQYPMMLDTERDNPFSRYQKYVGVTRPPSIKYQDLKELVEVNVSYSSLPFQVGEEYFRLDDEHALVPLTIQLDLKDLSFKTAGPRQVARVAVYGLIRTLTNQIAYEFEDDLVTSVRDSKAAAANGKKAAYQKIIPLQTRMRYKLDLVVEDTNSKKIGTRQMALSPPRYDGKQLQTSSLLLSDYIEILDKIPSDNQMFVLGDVKIRPNLSGRFLLHDPLGIYFQVYNARIDSATSKPSLTVQYQILREGRPILEETVASGDALQFVYGNRIVLIKPLTLAALPSGDYRIKVAVHDRISDQSAHLEKRIKLVSQ